MISTKMIFQDEKAPAYALLVITLKKYGTDILHVEPQLLRQEIEKDFNIHLSDLQSDKLQAAITVLTTDLFEVDWRVFETCCNLFCNNPVDHEDLNPLDAEDIATGVAEAYLIREGEVFHYDEEIRAYVGLIFHEYGLSHAPTIFPTAIIPKCNECDDSKKNDALKEVLDAHITYVLDYIEKIQ